MSQSPTAGPVRPSDRVSSVLARDERLVEVFATRSPQFAKLRIPAMRHVMAHLVTVEQAARICGADPIALIRDLNRALGIVSTDTVPEPIVTAGQTATPVGDASAVAAVVPQVPAWLPGAPIVELDVRDDLRLDREPFSRIMSAVTMLPEDGVLCLRTTFEPVPLFAVLGKRGYDHVAEQVERDDWRVWFYHSGSASVNAATLDVPATTTDEAAPQRDADEVAGSEMIVDVRGLEPPEPMQRTLEALQDLPTGAILIQINVRIPHFLLPILTERGFDYEIHDPDPGRVVVRIWRAPPETTDHPNLNHRSNPMSPATLAPVELDVRVIPPREKHPTIFHTFDSLSMGQSMLLINDHDPAPLRYQMIVERAGTFEWAYLEQGPAVWRVQITRR